MASPVGPAERPTDGPAPRWTVAAVAARVGVAPATLRSWSRRYGVGPVDHRAGRYRRYTDTDVAELETMRRLADDGMVLSAAAALARARHRSPPAPDPGTVHPDRTAPPVVDDAEVRALVRAAQRLDGDALVHTIDASLEQRDVITTWNRLCHPGLVALDPGSAGSATACPEGALVLARAITTTLHRWFPAAAPAPHAAPVILTCAPGEHHTVALEALFAALTENRVPARVLAPSAPLPALLHAVEHTRSPLVFVWAQRSTTARPTPLRRLLAQTSVVAAGPGWADTRLPPGVPWVNALDDAVRRARDTGSLTPPPGHAAPAG